MQLLSLTSSGNPFLAGGRTDPETSLSYRFAVKGVPCTYLPQLRLYWLSFWGQGRIPNDLLPEEASKSRGASASCKPRAEEPPALVLAWLSQHIIPVLLQKTPLQQRDCDVTLQCLTARTDCTKSLSSSRSSRF